MSIRQILKRVDTLEKAPSDNEGGFTLEELCHEMWRQDRKAYLKLAREKGGFMAFLATQFEQE